MNIVEKPKNYTKKVNTYALLRSKAGMKRDHWEFVECYGSVERIFESLHYIQTYHNNPSKFKYKIVKRSVVETLIGLCPKELMLLRIKHGV